MTELARRRRGLMGAKKKSDILYQLLNQTFDGGEINTGYAPLDTTGNRAFAYDATLTAQTSSAGNGANYWLMNVGTSDILRITKYNASLYMFVYRGNASSQSFGTPGNGRIRFVINVEMGVKATLHFRKDSGSVVTKTITKTDVGSTSVLRCGKGSSTGNELPRGTLNSLTVYNRLLTVDEINAFLEVS